MPQHTNPKRKRGRGAVSLRADASTLAIPRLRFGLVLLRARLVMAWHRASIAHDAICSRCTSAPADKRPAKPPRRTARIPLAGDAPCR